MHGKGREGMFCVSNSGSDGDSGGDGRDVNTGLAEVVRRGLWQGKARQGTLICYSPYK